MDAVFADAAREAARVVICNGVDGCSLDGFAGVSLALRLLLRDVESGNVAEQHGHQCCT